MFKTQITRLLVLVVLVDICAMIGCHRGYYRRQADAEAQRLITEKANDPRWDNADGSIEIDPQSRMFNPFSSDHPPIPPDDAASHQFMHSVDGKPGYSHWHANGDTDHVENPEWKSYLPTNENGQVVLTLDRAYELALIHSPDFQEQKETLYLSALDVSLERFGFDSQLFSGFNSFFATEGRLRSGNGGRSSSEFSSSLGSTGGGNRLERLGISGTTFAVGLANSILFSFTGPNTQSATSLIDFSVIQPLLRGAGRERILESLTQSERTLLANVRQMDRFRRGFYLEIAIGRNAGTGPNRSGNFLGLPGAGSTSAGSASFVGLLLQQQQIRNREFNVRQLEAVLDQFQEFFERQRLDAVQVKQFEGNVYTAQSDLINAKISYQAAVDRFKQTLGLPPDLDIVIEDDFLKRFELISDQINDRLIEIAKLREETGSALNDIDELLPQDEDLETTDFQWSADAKKRIDALVPFVESAQKTLAAIENDDLQQLDKDFSKLDSTRSERLAYLKKLEGAIASGDVISDIDPGLFKADSIPDSEELKEDLFSETNQRSIVVRIDNLNQEFERTQAIINEIEQVRSGLDTARLTGFLRENLQESIPGLLSELNSILLEVSLLQAKARSNSIELSDVSIDSTAATKVARCMRRDWMNARASLVDEYRNIEFVADQLEGQVDLVFEGDIGNVGDNPTRLRYETGQLRAGFRFDSPLVRVSERNNYRSALISYQQSKRDYYQFEDEVQRNLRDLIRNINRNKVLFELGRRSVQVAIDNVEITRFELEAPIALRATTAQNLTIAINSLNNEQNRFLGTWVQFEVLRRNLDFDMGTMQLDSVGAWIDPGEITPNIGYQAAAAMGIELDCQFCNLDQAYEETYDSYDNVEVAEPDSDTDDEMNEPEPGDVDPKGDFDIPSKVEPADELKIEPPKDANNYYRRSTNKLGSSSADMKIDAKMNRSAMAAKSKLAGMVQRLPSASEISTTPGSGKTTNKQNVAKANLSHDLTRLVGHSDDSTEQVRGGSRPVSHISNRIDRIIGSVVEEKIESASPANPSPSFQDWDRDFNSFGSTFNRFRPDSSKKN